MSPDMKASIEKSAMVFGELLGDICFDKVNTRWRFNKDEYSVEIWLTEREGISFPQIFLYRAPSTYGGVSFAKMKVFLHLPDGTIDEGVCNQVTYVFSRLPEGVDPRGLRFSLEFLNS